nr:putative reverse transcriptase domain-containing protein [Tanacetum cinerariifolium]
MSSDETSFGVTYTSISSDYEEPSDVGSVGVVAPLLSDYVLRPEYPEYLAASDEEVPVEDRPYDAADLPVALSLGYIADLDSKEDLEDESKDGPTDYPADGGDDDDDDSSGDDVDDEDENEAYEVDEDEEEEEHLASADSTIAVVDHVPSAEETELFETDESTVTPPPPPAYRTTAKMSIRAQTPIPFPYEAEVDKLLTIPTSPPSPLTPLSSPLSQIPSSFLIPSPPTTSPTYTEAPLGYKTVGIRLRTASPPPLPFSSPLPLPPPIMLPRTRASMVFMRVTAPSTYILSPRSRTPPILHIPLPTSSLPLPLPSTECRADVPETVWPPQKRLCIPLGPRFKARESSFAAAARSTGGFRADDDFVGTLDAEIRRDPDREVGYRITNIWVDPTEAVEEIPPTTLAELSQRVTDFVTTTTISALQSENEELQATHRRRQTQLLEALTQHEHDRFREFQCTKDVAQEDADKIIISMAMEAKVLEVVLQDLCALPNQVKFATCTLHGVALTWWKSHVKKVGHDATYDVPWNTLMKMITAEYCPRNEMKKLEMEIWELKIKQRIQAARGRQKSYADLKRKPMEFQVRDRVMLKDSPWKGVVRFVKWGKLNPRYAGPFKVLEKVGSIAYKLELPQELSKVHNTFHVFNLKMCSSDEPLADPLDGIHIDDKLHFIEEPVDIMDREVKRLKQSRIPIVKVW